MEPIFPCIVCEIVHTDGILMKAQKMKERSLIVSEIEPDNTRNFSGTTLQLQSVPIFLSSVTLTELPTPTFFSLVILQTKL